MALTSKLTAICDATRAKLGTASPMTLDETALSILTIPTGGGDADPIIDGSATEITSNVMNVAQYKFYYDRNLQQIILPNATEIGLSAFANASALERIGAPNVSVVNGYAFDNCTHLKFIDFFESITTLNGQRQFYGIAYNGEVYMPNLTSSIQTRAFQSSHISAISAPLALSIDASSLNGCNALEYIEASSATSVGGYSINMCYSLRWISFDYAQSLPRLVNSNSLDISACPNVKIYVPDALVADVATETNWPALANNVYPLSQKPVNEGHVHV